MNKRLETNLKIADILIETEWETKYKFGTTFKELARMCPYQRAGQIICNYICPDYRDEDPLSSTTEFLKWLFPLNYDPFYEESNVTLERLLKLY